MNYFLRNFKNEFKFFFLKKKLIVGVKILIEVKIKVIFVSIRCGF